MCDLRDRAASFHPARPLTFSGVPLSYSSGKTTDLFIAGHRRERRSTADYPTRTPPPRGHVCEGKTALSKGRAPDQCQGVTSRDRTGGGLSTTIPACRSGARGTITVRFLLIFDRASAINRRDRESSARRGAALWVPPQLTLGWGDTSASGPGLLRQPAALFRPAARQNPWKQYNPNNLALVDLGSSTAVLSGGYRRV